MEHILLSLKNWQISTFQHFNCSIFQHDLLDNWVKSKFLIVHKIYLLSSNPAASKQLRHTEISLKYRFIWNIKQKWFPQYFFSFLYILNIHVYVYNIMCIWNEEAKYTSSPRIVTITIETVNKQNITNITIVSTNQ